jgi:beta-glucanase (GH16 family)
MQPEMLPPPSRALDPVAPPPPRPRRPGTGWIERTAVAAVILAFLIGGGWSTLRLHHNSGSAQLQNRVDGVETAGSATAGTSASPSLSPSPSRVASAAAGRSPSGVPMPVGDLPRWHQVVTEDFSGTGLSDDWNVYDGQPGGDPAGWWDRSHVIVDNGTLTIRASKGQSPHGQTYITGGIANSPSFSQAYGRFDIRFRMDKGLGIAYALLLWPTSNVWPPEIDIMEDNGHYRSDTSATLHYGANNSMVFRKVSGDFTKWHTASLEWTPGRLVYYLDGKVWTTIAGSYVPKEPMHIAIQTQAWPCGGTWEACPDATTPPVVDLQVDWVTAYSWKGN